MISAGRGLQCEIDVRQAAMRFAGPTVAMTTETGTTSPAEILFKKRV
jgi:hypothetical protein